MMQFKQGSTRNVLLVWRYAVKTPRMVEWRLFLCGLLANMQERDFWGTGRDDLCPVLFTLPLGILTIMRRAIPLTDGEWDSLDCDTWGKYDNYIVPVEMKRDSFGTINGKVVAIDYGS